MLKKIMIKRITLASILLLILFLFTFFPNREKESNLNIKEIIEYTSDNPVHEVFLLDKYNYVARTSIVIKSTDTESKIRELLESLIIDGKKESNIPNGFRAIIPVDTKILDVNLKDGILKINFSKEILEVDKSLEEKMIEAITYTLTGVDGVKGILIYVEGELLDTLEKTKIKIPTYLTRDFGINKEYDLTTTQNITKTTIYYLNKNNDDYYYVPVTKVSNDSKDKINIIIDELASGPIYQSNLMSFLNSNTKVLDYKIKDDTMTIKFNSYIFDNINTKKIIEEVKYSISYSIADNYNVNEIIFMVDDQQIEKSVIKTLE